MGTSTWQRQWCRVRYWLPSQFYRLLDVVPGFVLHNVCRRSIHNQRLRLLPNVHCCVLFRLLFRKSTSTYCREPIGSTDTFAASAYFAVPTSITHCGHTRSSDGHQPAEAKPPPCILGYPDACDRRTGNPSTLRPFLSTRGRAFRLLLPPRCTCPSTAPGECLHGGLLEGSCGRRCRRGMPNGHNVGEPTYYLFQIMK